MKKASEYFHQGTECYNCAQSVLKCFQNEFNIPEDVVLEFKQYGGGRAENGVCGALFAANYLLTKKNKNKVNQLFAQKTGYEKCTDIKQNKTCSCIECINIAEDLVNNNK